MTKNTGENRREEQEMLRAFWQSKLALCATVVGSWALTAVIWVRRFGNGPLYIPIVASILMLALGVMLGRLIGNLVASNRNVKVLGYLHVDLDPEKFLAVYEDVPGKMKAGCLDQAVAYTYLADGYAAKGDFAQAIQAMERPEVTNMDAGKQTVALRGMCLQKLCGYQISAGQGKEAKKTLDELEGLIAANPEAKGELLSNLKRSARLLQNRLAAAGNKQVDTSWLEAQLTTASYKLLRLELWQTLAHTALRDGEEDTAQKYLQKLAEEGGKTWYAAWAKERLA